MKFLYLLALLIFIISMIFTDAKKKKRTLKHKKVHNGDEGEGAGRKLRNLNGGVARRQQLKKLKRKEKKLKPDTQKYMDENNIKK